MATAREHPAVSPTVKRIFSALKGRIHSGDYREGEWLPSERALAEEFHVSRILIRAAVKELEREKLISCFVHRRPLVRGGISDPPPGNRVAATTARWSVALSIWPQRSWPGTAMMIQGIQEALGEEYRLVLGNTIGITAEEIRASEARFLRQLCRDKDIKGVILSYMGGEKNLPYLEDLRRSGIPIVFLDHHPPAGFDADYVGVNNKRSAEQAVKHLLSLGHRTIAHVSNYDKISTVAERLAGYRRALEQAGIPFRPDLVERDPGPAGDNSGGSCETILARLLSRPDPPTAIFAVHDVSAYWILEVLRARGLRVPEDLSLVGFDGIERWMPTAPFLTTPYQPFDEIGAQAAELLKDRIDRGPKAPYKHVIIDAPVRIHVSTRALQRDVPAAGSLIPGTPVPK